MTNKRSRSEQARINGAKSKGPKTEQGLQKCREAAAARGFYAIQTATLPTESNEAYAELRREFFAFWSPRCSYEARRVELLVRLAWESDRIEMSRHDLLLQAMAEVRKHDPAITAPETLNARTETRITSSGAYERQDRRLQRINTETSRVERDLIRLKKLPPSPDGSQMLLETKEHRPSGPAEVLPMPQPCAAPSTLSHRPHIVRDIASLPELPDQQQPDIVQWAQSNFQFEPGEAQKQLLTDQSGRVLMCAGRQTGKSTAAALKIVYEAIHQPGSLILVAAPSERQSSQLMDKARRFAAKLTNLKGPSTGNQGFRLPNGSEVIALPDNVDTVRGFSAPSLIVIDEAAYVSDDLFAALLPAQAVSNGAVILLGTPNGQSGVFCDLWHDEKASWTRIRLRSADCPRINPEWLKAMRLQLGEHQYRQEFECEFLPGPEQPFSLDLLRSCISDDIQPLTTEPWL